MNRKPAGLLVITLFSLLTPVVAGNMPSFDFPAGYGIEGTGVIVPEGYWVYGTVRNGFMTKSMSEIVVEVTLLDSSGGELDVITATVRQTIVALGDKGSFLAKSSTQDEVAEIKYRLESYEETANINFKYLELSTIWTVDTGVTGWLENTHDFIYVHEAEVIATFLDAEGNVVDIQSYGLNDYGKFDIGEKKKWFCETEEAFDSYFLSVQSNIESRESYLRLTVERPNKVLDSWTPPICETILLILKDEPHYGRDIIDVVITDPRGNSNTRQFVRSGLFDFRYEITPDIPGVWNVTWVTEPFFVEAGTWAEGVQLDTGFFTWDPNAEEMVSNSTELDEVPPVEEGTINTTIPDIEFKIKEDSTNDSDSPTSAAEELIELIPDEVKQKIPGFPFSSMLAGFVVVYFLVSRKN